MVKFKTNFFNIALNTISITILVSNWALVLFYYFDLPNIINSHYNILGEPDNSGNKIIILLLPILSLITYMGFSYLEKRPHLLNYPVPVNTKNSKRLASIAIKAIILIKLIVLLLFLFLSYTMVFNNLESSSSMNNSILMFFVGLIVFTLVYFINKMYKAK